MLLFSCSDWEDGICDENIDEDVDDEESIGLGIEDKDIEWRILLVFIVFFIYWVEDVYNKLLLWFIFCLFVFSYVGDLLM